MEDKFLNSVGVAYLWNKSNGKFLSKSDVEMLGNVFVLGYHYANKFYEDPNLTLVLDGEEERLYIDISTNAIYRYDTNFGYIKLTASGAVSDGSSSDANGIEGIVLNDDYSLTIRFTNGTSYTTECIRGEKGEPGDVGPQGEKGEPGDDGYKIAQQNGFDGTVEDWLNSLRGAKGDVGERGSDGISPSVKVESTDGGYRITITDKDGSHEMEIMNGESGDDGQQGVPGVGIKDIQFNDDYTISIVLDDNTAVKSQPLKGVKGDKGEPGRDGSDGISCFHRWDGTTLIIESANGTSSVDLKGRDGSSGVYVGSGDMPEGCNVQINPDGVVPPVLPVVSQSDNGKFLIVEDGMWTAITIHAAEGGEF